MKDLTQTQTQLKKNKHKKNFGAKHSKNHKSPIANRTHTRILQLIVSERVTYCMCVYFTYNYLSQNNISEKPEEKILKICINVLFFCIKKCYI